MGGDLGGLGDSIPPKFEVGMTHAYIPPIFGEHVICYRNMQIFWKHVIETYKLYMACHCISGEKVIRKFWVEKWKFCSKKGHSEIWLKFSGYGSKTIFDLHQTQGQVSTYGATWQFQLPLSISVVLYFYTLSGRNSEWLQLKNVEDSEIQINHNTSILKFRLY